MAALVASVGLCSCAGSSAVRAARAGDFGLLGRELLAAEARGRLTLHLAADVSRAVVEREISSAPTPELALARVRDVTACAFEVDFALAQRMKKDDAAAGAAALERIETGALGYRSARPYAASSHDGFRAAAVWALTRDEDRDARLKALTDGSASVRRSALHAIVEHGDPLDFPSVLETARLDPDPLVRGSAVRALARLPGAPDDLANRLRDLWATADDGLRDDVATAFASRRVARQGGREALAHLLSGSSGNDAVTVAGAILGSGLDDVALRGLARARLVAALGDTGHRARIHAIAIVPLGSDGPEGRPAAGAATKAFLEPLRLAAHAEDLDVRLAALGRLSGAEVPKADRDAAVQALEALARPEVPPASRVSTASRARLLLAEAGDGRVLAWVLADLHSVDADVRLGAADALSAMGRASRVSPLLADVDARVRTRAACTILLATKLRSGRFPP